MAIEQIERNLYRNLLESAVNEAFEMEEPERHFLFFSVIFQQERFFPAIHTILFDEEPEFGKMTIGCSTSFGDAFNTEAEAEEEALRYAVPRQGTFIPLGESRITAFRSTADRYCLCTIPSQGELTMLIPEGHDRPEQLTLREVGARIQRIAQEQNILPIPLIALR
jgi:hypothetical protein